jgi:putative ABC transport system permease protein
MGDVLYAFRLLRRSPLFTAAVVLITALGIGGATAIFSIVNAVLIRPLPFDQPDRLMQVAEKNDALHLPAFGASALNYLSWQERTRTFEQLAAVQFTTFTLTGTGDPETYTGFAITSSLMPMLGIRPLAGRGFGPDDDKIGAAPVALISESLWRRRFGGDPAAIGQSMALDGTATTIVGISPPSLGVLTGAGDIWTPLIIDPAKQIRLNHVLFVAGRLAPGVTRQSAQAEMDGIANAMRRTYPEMKDWGVNLITFTDTFVSTQLRTALLVLLAGVVFVLLIVSANVANLLLARAMERRKEMAVRSALGAGRGRLVRQLLIESLLLSAVGGGFGVVAAAWCVYLLQSSLPQGVLPVPDVGVDRVVVVFAVAISVVTGVVFGLAPAWQSAKTDVNAALKETSRSSAGGIRPAFRKMLAAGELALATVLLVGAVLLVRTLQELQRAPLGFNPDRVISFQIALPPTRYIAARRTAFFTSLANEIRALPGVEQAGVSSGIPFGAGNYTTSPFGAPGSAVLPGDASVPVDWRAVGPGYFATMTIPLLRGREFTDADDATAPDVMIVSRAAARTFWGDADPIGRVVQRVADKKNFTVVGVVGDVRSTTLNRESPAVYYSAAARLFTLTDVVVRTASDQGSLMRAVREKVRAKDPNVPLTNVRPMFGWVAASAAQPRLSAELLGIFAAIALLVAAVGTYGVLAYSVSQRTKELGLRMALGADRRGVLTLVLREGLAVSVVGLAIGVAGASGLAHVLSSLVFGVSVHDPVTYAGASAALFGIAFAACAVPAIRASHVDPMTALRLD